ncbi:MAG TPA: hypothetical protein PLT91_07190 [Clostridia bacterium]|jgi:hypothetical protein|nr:MAG: hypothetical protein BWX97_00446 [Firmicutes bacterium ADurb.Bin146]HOD93632.1 hypothetical protein [Clostridia bacterium]HQM40006.1 hypothetical protein [Clostridia bacterium]
MRIQIKSKDEKNINLLLPTSLVLSNLTAVIAASAINKKIDKKDCEISSRDLCKLMAVMRKVKKKYGRFELVDIQSSDGDIVKIVL